MNKTWSRLSRMSDLHTGSRAPKRTSLRSKLGAGLGATLILACMLAGADAGAQQQIPYQGGPIQLNPKVYVVYWGMTPAQLSAGAWPGDSYGVVSEIRGFLNGVGGTQYLSTLTQYTMRSGRVIVPFMNPQNLLRGEWADNQNPIPANPTNTNYAAEATLAATHFGVTPGRATGEIFLITAGPGVNLWSLASSPGSCGYHASTGNIAYIILPYQGTGGNSPGTGSYCGSQLGVQASTSSYLMHELAESITDPLFASGATAWSVGTGQTEVGDSPCDPASGGGTQLVQLQPSGSAYPATYTIQQLWSDAARPGGGCVTARSTASSNFYASGDGSQIWVQQNTNNFASLWGSPSTSFTTPPAVASWGPYRYDLFAFDANGHLGHLYQATNGGTVGWDDWDVFHPRPWGNYFGRPAVTSWGNSRLDVFAKIAIPGFGFFDIVHQSWDNGADNGWSSLSVNQPCSAPAATTWGPNEIDVFFVGSDNALHHSSSQDGVTFSAWTSAGSPIGGVGLASDPAAAAWGPGRLDVFVVNTGGSLSHYFSNDSGASWGQDQWSAPGLTFTGSPSVSTMGDQRLKVVATTTNGTFYEWLWDFISASAGELNAAFDPLGSASAVTFSAP